MTNYKNRYRGTTTRLRYWDYRWAAAYFITICTKDREHFFGNILHGQMFLNDLGEIVQKEWLNTVVLRPDMNLTLGQSVVMPIIFMGSS